ncbi:hypothetical protein [Vreelandella profundi]|uniref:hypothetical protein n=1 Tax=Vreelandella profundi TaxID=2852117 RepID=UPI001F2E0FAA|nr:hypothetical protein [Halomonas profundi]
MPNVNAMPSKENVRTPPAPCNQQLNIYITAEERERIEKVARDEMRTVSATIRMLSLRGLSQYKNETLIAD